MTTIIAIQKEDYCVFYADSRVTSSDTGAYSQHPAMKKIIRNGAFLIAGSGEVGPCDIVAHVWKPITLTTADKKDLYHFMIKKVAPSMRKCLSDNGHDFEFKNPDGEPRFTLLVACGGMLFEFADDLSITLDDSGLYGAGSGNSFAKGAILAGATPEVAIGIAAKLSLFTGGPIQVETQDKY